MHWFQNLNLRGHLYCFHILNQQCLRTDTILPPTHHTWMIVPFLLALARIMPLSSSRPLHLLTPLQFSPATFIMAFSYWVPLNATCSEMLSLTTLNKSSSPISLFHGPVYFLYINIPIWIYLALFIIHLPPKNISFVRAGPSFNTYCLILSSWHGAQGILHLNICEMLN